RRAGHLRPRPGAQHRLLHGRRVRGLRPGARLSDRRRRPLRRAACTLWTQPARGRLRAGHRPAAHRARRRGARDRRAARPFVRAQRGAGRGRRRLRAGFGTRRREAHGRRHQGQSRRGSLMAGIHDLTIAVPRGALVEGTVDMLARLGLDTEELRSNERKLLFEDIGVITMRPSDVPTYVEAGAADLGITGKDVLMEQPEREVYELVDLGYGHCTMVLATVAGEDRAAEALRRLGVVRIATKYPRVAAA